MLTRDTGARRHDEMNFAAAPFSLGLDGQTDQVARGERFSCVWAIGGNDFAAVFDFPEQRTELRADHYCKDNRLAQSRETLAASQVPVDVTNYLAGRGA